MHSRKLCQDFLEKEVNRRRLQWEVLIKTALSMWGIFVQKYPQGNLTAATVLQIL